MNPLIIIISVILALALGAIAGYLFHRYQADKALQNQQQKAESILKGANEQARLIETQARESAAKIVQAAEGEIKERRHELSRETERLDKRRSELDNRADRLEQREPIAANQCLTWADRPQPGQTGTVGFCRPPPSCPLIPPQTPSPTGRSAPPTPDSDERTSFVLRHRLLS